jgi:hypothetical protein
MKSKPEIDYSQYTKLEFRRRILATAPTIYMYDGETNKELGYIRSKFLIPRSDIRLYADDSKNHEIIRIKPRRITSLNMTFDIFDAYSDKVLFTIQNRGTRSILRRDYWRLMNEEGHIFGAINETSSFLAIFRRWIIIVPFIGWLFGLLLMFVPQKFDILYFAKPKQPLIAGKVIHRKNPIKVKIGVDYTDAIIKFDPKLYISAASLLSILDVDKRR